MPSILELTNVTKMFESGDHSLTVLTDITFSVEEGSSSSIVGPSGSGKTTLLGLCAGLDSCTSGDIRVNRHNMNEMDEEERAFFRSRNVGFVFQNFQLIPTLTALENVMIPLELQRQKNVVKQAKEMIDRVGLSGRLEHYPVQLSGGEQQRIALARAFVNMPKILFADEPTGNLDAETSQAVSDLMFQMNRDAGTTLVLVSHDMDLAGKTEKILTLKGGMVDGVLSSCEGQN